MLRAVEVIYKIIHNAHEYCDSVHMHIVHMELSHNICVLAIIQLCFVRYNIVQTFFFVCFFIYINNVTTTV